MIPEAGAGVPASILADLARVLCASGMRDAEVDALVRAVGVAADPAAVTDILLARPPRRPAWIARFDGHLDQNASGYLLAPETDGDIYAPEPELFGPLDGRVLRVPLGSAVRIGEALTDDPCDAMLLYKVMGKKYATANLAKRLTGLCAMDEEQATRVVGPLFDALEVTADSPFPSNRPWLPGTVFSDRRWKAEQGKAIAHALRDLPNEADPRLTALAALSDDAERARTYTDQRLGKVMADAGLKSGLMAGCGTYLGVRQLSTLLENDGVLAPVA
jgi:hypothetical protein